MTEEIIIDGVNVAGCCKCYNVEQKILCGASGICENNPNCYYKQLKRLEQENKALKDNNNHLRVIIDDGRAENKRFREENKDLKKKLELDEVQLESYFVGEEKICKENEKYRKALEEINKIAEPRFVNGLNEEADLCNLAMDRIQNKINEVLQ